jgi:hypothetical protein
MWGYGPFCKGNDAGQKCLKVRKSAPKREPHVTSTAQNVRATFHTADPRPLLLCALLALLQVAGATDAK